MNPVGQTGAPSRPRAQSIRIPQNGLNDEPKIVEEGAEGDITPLSSSSTAAVPIPIKRESDDDSFSDEDLHDDEETGLTGKDKRRKQKKRRRHTRLDQRVVPDKKISEDEQKEADRNVAKRLTVNGVLILLWYFFSLSISLVRAYSTEPFRLRIDSTFNVTTYTNMTCVCSTTSGCLTRTALTLRFRYSPRRRTCLCNSFYPPWCCTLCRLCGHSTLLIWGGRDMRQSLVRP